MSKIVEFYQKIDYNSLIFTGPIDEKKWKNIRILKKQRYKRTSNWLRLGLRRNLLIIILAKNVNAFLLIRQKKFLRLNRTQMLGIWSAIKINFITQSSGLKRRTFRTKSLKQFAKTPVDWTSLEMFLEEEIAIFLHSQKYFKIKLI